MKYEIRGKMSMECPNCGKQTNFSDCRLIQDSCGHEKCRMCLLYEEDGCKTCNDLLRIIPTFPPDAGEQQPMGSIPYPSPLLPEDQRLQQKSPSPSGPPYALEPPPLPLPQPVRNKPPKPPDRNHIVTLPGTPVRYKCTICLKIFRNLKGQCYHDVCRTGISPYHCTECGKTFVKKSHFEYHERMHTGYKPFSCSICSKSFPQRNKLNRHMQSHNPEKKYLCSFCGKRYAKMDDLTTHSMLHTGAKPHSCPTCGKAFRIRASLTRHIRSHSSERPYTCDTCGKSFKEKGLLVRHRKIHGKERPYSCAHCSKPFLSKSELRRHVASHSDDKPFPCTFCNIAFRRKDNLSRHIRHHHMASNPEWEISSLPKVQDKRSDEGKRKEGEKRKDGEKRQCKKNKGKHRAEEQETAATDANTEISPRVDTRGVITPVIRAPRESSNAVPVINGPISIPKPWDQPVATKTVLMYTVPIPSREAIVINQRIEQKLYQQGSEASGVYFYTERPSRESYASVSFPPLGHNAAVRAVSGGRRISGDSSFSPPMSENLTELRSAPGMEALREGSRRGSPIMGDERVNIQLRDNNIDSTNCVSTIRENFGCETRWKKRPDNFREHPD
ncbi:zinc finger protein 577-like [Diachasmimorpha longicaudata]|uniref:zinc finger protein 577-like n=1 Tax=Diachasmimorpha longicaudata TaxID=58733 RepID=UPI0030B8E8C9